MQILYSKQAKKYVEILDKSAQIRVRKAIEAIPLRTRELKIKGVENLKKLRIGNLRVLYERNDDIIYIILILPRGQVYKRI